MNCAVLPRPHCLSIVNNESGPPRQSVESANWFPMRRQCVPERAAAAAAALFCQHSATIVKWYFCAMCLLPRSLARSSLVRRRLGSPPFRQSSQCVNSGSGRRRGAAAAAADKAQTGAQTSRKYGIVRQTAGCQRGYGTLQVAALIRPIGPVPGALFNVFNACMERRSMRRIASSSNPSGLPPDT